MKHTLTATDFALKIPHQALNVSSLPGLVGECRRRAGEEGLKTTLAEWLVVRGRSQAAILADILDEMVEDVGRRMHPVRDAGNIVHLSFVKMQLAQLRQYLERGWRVGLCAPWQITDTSGGYPVKVHAARILRSTTEPYILRQDRPVCRGYVPSPGGYVAEEITCQVCVGKLAEDPQHYPLATPTS